MSEWSVQQSDVGVVIQVQFVNELGEAIDISSCVLKRIYCTKESGTTFTWIPSFLTNGTDGKIVYTTMPGDLDEIGEYQIQGMYANTNGDTFRSGIGRLAVRPSLTPVDARTLVLSGSLTAVHHTNNN